MLMASSAENTPSSENFALAPEYPLVAAPFTQSFASSLLA